MTQSRYDRFYAIIRQIPEGRVATYGQVARLAGFDRCARQVGYALAALRDSSVPWHRVVNASGAISERTRSDGAWEQRDRLCGEGINFSKSGRINLKTFGWQPF